jgi:hypothetical protein
MTIERDHRNTYTHNDRTNIEDMPKNLFEINYNPYWGAFYYHSKGYLYLMHDPNADREDACVDKSCD